MYDIYNISIVMSYRYGTQKLNIEVNNKIIQLNID